MLLWLLYFLSIAGSMAEPPLSVPQQRSATAMLQMLADNRNYTENVFFSPYSVYGSLYALVDTSAGDTEKYLLSILDLIGRSLWDIFQIIYFKNDNPEIILTSVCRIYHTPDIKVKDNMYDFFMGYLAVFKTFGEINKWISDKTGGMIEQLLDGNETKPQMGTLAVVDAAYFKGAWEVPLTGPQSKKPFTLPDGSTKDVLFMSPSGGNATGLFRSMTDDDLQAQIISLPYKGGDISMIIILPTVQPKKGIPLIKYIVQSLSRRTLLKLVSKLEAQELCTTHLLIPKLHLDGKYDLKEEIKKYEGFFPEAFQHLNFSALVKPNQKIQAVKIVHQAKVNVYENGTEAADVYRADTGIGTTHSETLCSTTFLADHPFIYIIYDNRRSYIHYMGILNSPILK